MNIRDTYTEISLYGYCFMLVTHVRMQILHYIVITIMMLGLRYEV